MKKPVIECIRDFVMTFPELKEGCLMVDYLSEQPIEYAVESVPCERIYKRYKDGGVVKQFAFIFASREFYSADVLQCIENLAFYEHFENWILETGQETLDSFLDGRASVALNITSGGYAFDEANETARYQIQLNLIYEED